MLTVLFAWLRMKYKSSKDGLVYIVTIVLDIAILSIIKTIIMK